MSVTRLLGVARNCRNLEAACAFYRDACGFVDGAAAAPDEALMRLLRPADARLPIWRWLWRERQPLLLLQASAHAHPAPYPLPGYNLAFQHIALVTENIVAAHARWLESGVRPISVHGPQQLPPQSGGVAAFKGYDPDGHPIELLAFPPGKGSPATRGGIDHSAIAVRDGVASIGFYRDVLGLDCAAHQINRGAEQDRLDGLPNVEVEVVALRPRDAPAPHVELLAYRQPSPTLPESPLAPDDLVADHLLFAATGLERLVSQLTARGYPIAARAEEGGELVGVATRDPDGHRLILLERA